MANLTNYDDEFVAHALSVLKANGGNAKRAASILGVPRTTLRQWAGRAQSSTAVPKKVTAEVQSGSDEALAERFEAAFMLATDPDVLLEKRAKAGFRDLLIGADIATRGRALLRGQPTSRVQQLQVTLIGAGSLAELGGSVLKALNPGLQSADSGASRDTPSGL